MQTPDEITGILAILPRTYQELSEAERVAWLTTELQTRRPLIGAELPFSDKTKELIETFRVVRSLQQGLVPIFAKLTLSA